MKLLIAANVKCIGTKNLVLHTFVIDFHNTTTEVDLAVKRILNTYLPDGFTVENFTSVKVSEVVDTALSLEKEGCTRIQKYW